MTDWDRHFSATRAWIIQQAFAREGYPVDDETARAVAALVVTDSIRELTGAVIRVVAYASLADADVSTALAEYVLVNDAAAGGTR